MANEMRFEGSIQVSATNFSETIAPGAIQLDLSEKNLRSNVLVAPTTASGTEIASAGDSANGGIFFFRNLSASGNVEVGRKEGGAFKPFLLLKPGEYSLGRLAADLPITGGASILAVKGSTSNVEVQFTIFDGT
mgnify:CR=1 FL=1